MARATGLPLLADRDMLNVNHGATNGGAGTASVESGRSGMRIAGAAFFDPKPISADPDDVHVARRAMTPRMIFEEDDLIHIFLSSILAQKQNP
jgi:hypothetical protein